jgi:molybdopterin molybdotransferase
MLIIEEALENIMSTISPLPVERVPLLQARGRVLAEDAIAGDPIPTFAASAMDGYAVRAADVASASEDAPSVLRVIGEAAAGKVYQCALGQGEALRIFTGAPVPDGADAVVMQEVTHREGDLVAVTRPVATGRHIRPVGNDVPAGAKVLAHGVALTSASLGMLAAMGCDAVSVHRRPRIGILSTGDELIEPGSPLAPGCIYDSNRVSLHAQAEEAGAEVVSSLHVPDDAAALRSALSSLSGCDVIVSSGGVSVGDYDLVKDILAEGGDIDFWRVAIKPGKPLAFGHFAGIPFFGLPGNPVSAYVTFEVFVRPALRRLLGHARLYRPLLNATLTEPVEHIPGRREFVRARLDFDAPTPRIRPVGEQDSAVMSGMARADALIIVPENEGDLEPGTMVRASWLQEP